MHLVHLSVRGVHTENSASSTQENTVQHSKDNPSGEGLSSQAKMADCYTSKIQAIIQNNSGMTLQEKNDLIRDLLLQAQNDREIQLLRKISIPANRNFLVGSGPQGNTDNNQHCDNNNQNNNSNNHNNDNGTITTQSAPSKPPVNDNKADSDSNNIKNKDNSKNGQKQPAQKQKEKKQTKGQQKRKTKIAEDDYEEEEEEDDDDEEEDHEEEEDDQEGEQVEDEEEEDDDDQEEEEEEEEEEGEEVEEENDEEGEQEGEQEEEEWDEDEDRDESEDDNKEKGEDRKKKKDKMEKPPANKRASIGHLLKPSFANIRLHCRRARITFPKQKLSQLYGTLSTYLSCPLKNGFESLDRRFVLTHQQRVLFQSPHKQISMSLEKLSVSLILPRATLFKYLTTRLKQERAHIPYTNSDKILIRNFIRLSKLKRTSVPCVALRGNT